MAADNLITEQHCQVIQNHEASNTEVFSRATCRVEEVPRAVS